jgi:hypothetical protein
MERAAFSRSFLVLHELLDAAVVIRPRAQQHRQAVK